MLTCIREGCTIGEAGYRLIANAERHLKAPQEMARLFRGHQDAVERSLEIVERCRFSLDELRYEYPEEIVPAGETPTSHLRALTLRGMDYRWPQGPPPAVRENILRFYDQMKTPDQHGIERELTALKAFTPPGN